MRGAFDEEVNVVRHQTVGVERERRAGSAFEEKIADESCDRRIGKIRAAKVAADRDEMRSVADVVGGAETGDAAI